MTNEHHVQITLKVCAWIADAFKGCYSPKQMAGTQQAVVEPLQ